MAVDFLERHVPGIGNLNYFGHVQTKLFKRLVMISRAGYAGKRSNEIFARAKDLGGIWDAILEDGRGLGVVPAAFAGVDALRVESYLLFYPFDNSQVDPFAEGPQGETPWEFSLDFTVSLNKRGFRGAR